MYRRETREVPLFALPAPLGAALAEHAAKHQLTLDGARAWLTRSENPPAEGFVGRLLGRRANPVDPDAEHYGVLLLVATHVLVATSGEKRGTTVLSLPLMQASFSRGAAAPAAIAATLEVGEGFTLTGFPGTVGRPGTHFVGLGAGECGEACARAVEEAIVRAKNTPG